MVQGYDCVVHMSEEVKEASKVIPPTILWGMWINAAMMFLVGVTFIFTMGNTANILETPDGVPFIQAFLNATGSFAATNTVVAFIVIMLVTACVSEVATASCQIWSFARDRVSLPRHPFAGKKLIPPMQGLPFSSWLARVTPGWNIPLNAVMVSIVFTSALSLVHPLLCSLAALESVLIVSY